MIDMVMRTSPHIKYNIKRVSAVSSVHGLHGRGEKRHNEIQISRIA